MNTAYPFSFSAHLSPRSLTTHRTLWNTKLKVTWYFKHSTAGYSRGIEENSILAEWIFKLPFFLEVQLVPFSPDYHALPKNQSKEKSMSARINWQIQKRKRNHTKLLSFKMSHSLLVWLASTPRLLILYNQLAQTSSEDTRNRQSLTSVTLSSTIVYCQFSKIQLVVYYQCCVLIGWATTRLYVIAH